MARNRANHENEKEEEGNAFETLYTYTSRFITLSMAAALKSDLTLFFMKQLDTSMVFLASFHPPS